MIHKRKITGRGRYSNDVETRKRLNQLKIETFLRFNMHNVMQKIVIFIEPKDFPPHASEKLGNLFMNRFAIDEDESNEVLKIVELKNALFHIKYVQEEEKGLDCNEYR